MPTENRSSNTEMVSVPFRREDRYIVVKRSDLDLLSPNDRDLAMTDLESALSLMSIWDCPAREYLVIESDWPEFEPAWAAIEARVTGKPAEQHQGATVTWDVAARIADIPGVHEALALFSEDPTGDAGASLVREVLEASKSMQHQGEPVAWMDPRSPRMHATISNEIKQHNLKFGGAPASAVNGYTIPLYTHTDPGEVERLKAELVESDHAFVRIASEAEQLRAQLAERDALLRDIRNSHGVMLMTHPPQDPWLNNRIDERIRAALSVGGAPSQQELTEDNPNGQTEP